MFSLLISEKKSFALFENLQFYFVQSLRLALTFFVLFIYDSFHVGVVFAVLLASILISALIDFLSDESDKRIYASEVWAAFIIFMLFLYVVSGPFSVFKFVIVFVFSLYLFCQFFLVKITDNKRSALIKGLAPYSIALHELAHFSVNERLSVYESKYIALSPSLGHFKLGKRLLNDFSYSFAVSCLILAGTVATEVFINGNSRLTESQLISIAESEMVRSGLNEIQKKKLLERLRSDGYVMKVYERTLELLNEDKDKLFTLCDMIVGMDRIDCAWLKEQYYKI